MARPKRTDSRSRRRPALPVAAAGAAALLLSVMTSSRAGTPAASAPGDAAARWAPREGASWKPSSAERRRNSGTSFLPPVRTVSSGPQLPEPGRGVATIPTTDRPAVVEPPATVTAQDSPPPAYPEPAQNAPGDAAKGTDLATNDIGASVNVIPECETSIIDLMTALRLAEMSNPQIAIARTTIQQAVARQIAAKSLVLPHLRAGSNFHLHNGILQNSFGLMRKVNARSFYLGGGARTLAAETVGFPAVQIAVHLGDALYEPLAAKQLIFTRQFEAQATSQEIFLEVANRYLEIMSAEAELKALRQSEVELAEIVRLTAAYARTGVGKDSDMRRARTEALLVRVEEERAQERLVVASAELARVLHLDPSVQLRTPAGAIARVDLVDPQSLLPDLVSIAQRARPDLVARSSEIERRDILHRQTKSHPFFPDLLVNFSGGAFNGWTNRLDLVPQQFSPGWQPFLGRDDFDVLCFWTLDNGGVGNIVKTRQARNDRDLASLEWQRARALAERQVVEAYGRVQQTSEAIRLSEDRLAQAERGLQEEITRIRGAEGLPLEVLDSMNLLIQARNALIQATIAYDRAQFDLFVAIGQSPLCANFQDPASGTTPPEQAPAPAPAAVPAGKGVE